jgi:hypothetical protein
VADNHPLSDKGTAQFVLDDQQPLFAADQIDTDGHPVLPRQEPYTKFIQLFMTQSEAPDRGAYVDVQVNPPGLLRLLPVDDTCEQLAGAFRCTAQDDGFANFLVASESDNSGIARLNLVGRSNGNEQTDIEILPAGLPDGALNFNIIMEGSDVITGDFGKLQCTFDAVANQTFDKWEKARVREAQIIATRPSAFPGVVQHAPVLVESLHPEVFVSRDPSCPEPHTVSMRVQLDDLGTSPPFYFCFSDLGGNNVRLSAVSGSQNTELVVSEVAATPRLLRLTAIDDKDQLLLGSVAEEILELSAFDANLQPVSLRVDVASTAPNVLAVQSPTLTLFAEAGVPQRISVDANDLGSAQITVAPQLFDAPVCISDPITVVP